MAAGLLALGMYRTPGAVAAVIYRIELEPDAPRVGERVVISVSTFEADSPRPGAELDPFPLDGFPWTFVADSPGGRTTEILLARDGRSPNRWTGTFKFPEPGRWEIGLDKRHLGAPPDPALGARVEVVVTGNDVDGPLPLLVGLVVLVAIVAIGLNRIRSAGIV